MMMMMCRKSKRRKWTWVFMCVVLVCFSRVYFHWLISANQWQMKRFFNLISTN